MNFRLFFLYITHAEYFSNIFAKRQQQELALNSTFLLPLSSALNPSLFLAYLNWRLKIGLNKWLWVASLIGCGGQWQVVFIAWTHAESASFVRNVERGREYNGFPHNYSIIFQCRCDAPEASVEDSFNSERELESKGDWTRLLCTK